MEDIENVFYDSEIFIVLNIWWIILQITVLKHFWIFTAFNATVQADFFEWFCHIVLHLHVFPF